MKKLTLLVMGLSALCLSASAQESAPAGSSYPGKTSFYAEFGGPGVLFSANIDTRFKKTHLGWGGRAGVGFVTVWDYRYDSINQPYYYYGRSYRQSIATFPVQVNYIFGKPSSPHTFEAGAGVTVLSKKADVFNNYDYYDDQNPTQFFGTFSFMYRRQPVNGGFTWRIGFTPLIGNGFIQPSGGASVGYAF